MQTGAALEETFSQELIAGLDNAGNEEFGGFEQATRPFAKIIDTLTTLLDNLKETTYYVTCFSKEINAINDFLQTLQDPSQVADIVKHVAKEKVAEAIILKNQITEVPSLSEEGKERGKDLLQYAASTS